MCGILAEVSGHETQKSHIETTIISYLASKPSRYLYHGGASADYPRSGAASPLIFQELTSRNSCWMKRAWVMPMRLRCPMALLGSFPLLDATSEALDLARALVERGAIPPRKAADAAHIAVATIHHMQFLLTWNCTHLANAEILAQVQAICAQLGYSPSIVCTPEALLGGQDDPLA